MVSCMTGVANTSSISGRSSSKYAMRHCPWWYSRKIRSRAPLLERLGEACSDSRDFLLRELLLEECSDGQAVFAQALQIRPSSELYAQVQQLIRTTWEGAAHLDAGSIDLLQLSLQGLQLLYVGGLCGFHALLDACRHGIGNRLPEPRRRPRPFLPGSRRALVLLT